MAEYTMTIGLEIHAELKTKTKMFCGCMNSGDEREPNVNICPICMGYPGTLPVINKSAVKKVLTVGSVLGSTLATSFTEFDRKNYFYPDIPKGYQISQYKYPLVSGGSLAGVTLTRIHLEEDTARSSHETPGVSLVDYNRAGVPLMELVTEPVIYSAEQAMKFAQELQLLLQTLDVSGANMEKGEMRVEVNISVSNTEKFGTKVEVKNINSFRAAGKAIEFEYARQVALLEGGKSVTQETRGWDENKNITFSQRSKENAHDYRYFPEPDLPKLVLSEIPEFSLENLKKELPELPWQKRARYAEKWGIKKEDIEAYVTNAMLGGYFESCVGDLQSMQKNVELNDPEGVKILSNYITSDLVGYVKNSTETFEDITVKMTPKKMATLVRMIRTGKVSSRGAKDILKIICKSDGEPEAIADEKGLIQKSDVEELKKIISEIIATNSSMVAEYKAGKESVLQFFVGQGMKATKGSGNPIVLKEIAMELLK